MVHHDSNFLKGNNAQHMWHPMAHPADMRANPPKMLVKGEGVKLIDIDGTETLDAVGGLWNVNLGFSVDSIKTAISEQLDALPYYSIFRGTTTDVAVEASYELAKWFEADGMERVFFTSGGSDAVETALRLARQFHKINGEPERTKFLSLKKGYHGVHFGGASVNGNANFRRNYEPLLPGCFHLPTPHTYRNMFNETDPEKLADLCVAAAAEEIAFQGADTIAAFIMEPVQGAGGVIVPPASYMPKMRALCDKHGILMIADEVVTAFGRTGAWTGSRLWGVKPDMMCIAKAVTNGYFPTGALLMNKKVTDAFESNADARGSIGHGYTYSGHPAGSAAVIATLEEYAKNDVAANSKARGEELAIGLQNLYARHELIGNFRGIGLMWAIELVADRETKAPADKKKVGAIFGGAYAAGAMIRVSGNNIILSPSLIYTRENVETLLNALDAGLAAAARV